VLSVVVSVALGLSLDSHVLGRRSTVLLVAVLWSLATAVIGVPLAGLLAGRRYAKRLSEHTGYETTLADGGWAGARVYVIVLGGELLALAILAALTGGESLRSAGDVSFSSVICRLPCSIVVGSACGYAGGAVGAWLSRPRHS